MRNWESQQTRTPRAAACFACRHRKSRCKQERGSAICLMCRSHDTQCIFPSPKRRSRAHGMVQSPSGQPGIVALTTSGVPTATTEQTGHSAPANPHRPLKEQPSLGGIRAISASHGETVNENGQIPEALDSPEDEGSNQRLIGPVLESDTRALSGILHGNAQGRHVVRTLWTGNPSGWSAPIVFTRTRKRPVGLDQGLNPTKRKLELIEKFLEPWVSCLVRLFMCKVNPCFPIFNETQFWKQYDTNRSFLSPALLSMLYAHAMIFWKSDAELARQRRPDIRFVWNIASEALYSELRLSPSIHTLAAILLNISGRPTSLVFNNSGQLGFAISVAYTLGLNRDPSTWDIPEHEKQLRRNVWHGILLYDRWSSLAYGIPPSIRRDHADVLMPQVEASASDSISIPASLAPAIFAGLLSLSELLYTYLDQMYRVNQPASYAVVDFANSIQAWVDSTTGITRRIVLRGSDLSTPGAANLRLAFLSVQFLHHRMALESQRKQCFNRIDNDNDNNNSANVLRSFYLHTKRSAEEVAIFVQELSPAELQDFWMPVLGFPLLSIMTFLVRSAAEFEDAAVASTDNNGAFNIAIGLMDSLRTHRADGDWDLGDLCLNQYDGVLQELQSCTFSLSADIPGVDALDFIIPDLTYFDTAPFNS